MTEIEVLKKDLVKLKNEYKCEIANLKINYIASIIVVIGYIFINQMGEFVLFGMTFTPMVSIIVFSFIVFLFFIKEAIIYGRFLAKKILGFKGV